MCAPSLVLKSDVLYVTIDKRRLLNGETPPEAGIAASSPALPVRQYNDDNANPIYANFEPPTAGTSATRIKLTDLPTLVTRVNKMPQYLSDEFKVLSIEWI